MIHYKLKRAGMRLLVALALLGIAGAAQGAEIQGLIKSRSGATMTVQTADSPGIIVLLTDNTKVSQIQGVFQARRKEMSMAALIPGLEIQLGGNYNEHGQLVAAVVKFKGNDLERARSIQAGLHETQVRAAETEAQAERNRLAAEQNREELAKQSAELKAQKDALQQQQAQLTAQQEKIAANKAAIAAASARFGQLDDYYILDEVTVYFGNGKVNLESQYEPQLLALAEKARKIEAYMVQVVGYASAAGSETLNQKLSEDRAGSVTNFLVQKGHVPLTNVLAPGAMGESRQVGSDKTAEAEAQNRRVVVRILQNKGIAGI